MKQYLSALLALALLCSCAAPAEENGSAPTCAELAQAVAEGQGYTDMTALPEEDVGMCLVERYGMEEGLWADAAIYAADGVDAREIAVIRLAEETDTNAAKQALRDYCAARHRDFYGYVPDQAELVGRGRWMDWEAGGETYVGLFICGDPPCAEKNLFAYLRETVPTKETPVPEGAETSAPPPDTSGYTPFVQPNESDMTLYDTAPILAAYRSGDASALSAKDTAILEVAAKAVEESVTEDMTDFEKELALHDWLIDWVEYDQTIHDKATPQGREDNHDPYGVLAGRYGNCLGYATAFQLLMDLAGVECITVVGATHNSTADHAWNMVRLEGDWYCVDVSWDDPVFEEQSYLTSEALRHQYFNVTSQFLYENFHQWDYGEVPWATATRFFWDGTTWRLPA